MPPRIVLLLCILFILCLFIIDFKRKSDISSALWIPLIWMMIIGSRFVSQWLNLGEPLESPDDYLEGSPLDRNVFLILIVSGLFIFSRRRMYWPQMLKSNAWIFLLFLYGGISIIWSDFPFVSFKRWIKGIGMLVMVLVVLTETDPVAAVKTTVRRCAYVLVPLSIVFIKYYPALGRSYSYWIGKPLYTGVTNNKNSLGALCLVCGIFFFWNLLTIRRNRSTSVDKKEVLIHVLFLLMIAWLFKMANSATSLLCFIIGVCILIWTGLPIKRNLKLFGSYIFFTGLVFLMLLFSFEIMQALVLSLGRDMTLTGRVDFWKEVIAVGTDPLLGTGYESFWLGGRAEAFWAEYWWHPNQAHNGYLETYLNQGWIGLFLLIGVMISAGRKCRRTFMFNYDYGRFQLAFLAIVLLYNVTEAAFHGLDLMRFFFLLVAMEVPRLSQLQMQGSMLNEQV